MNSNQKSKINAIAEQMISPEQFTEESLALYDQISLYRFKYGVAGIDIIFKSVTDDIEEYLNKFQDTPEEKPLLGLIKTVNEDPVDSQHTS